MHEETKNSYQSTAFSSVVLQSSYTTISQEGKPCRQSTNILLKLILDAAGRESSHSWDVFVFHADTTAGMKFRVEWTGVSFQEHEWGLCHRLVHRLTNKVIRLRLLHDSEPISQLSFTKETNFIRDRRNFWQLFLSSNSKCSGRNKKEQRDVLLHFQSF